jgi:serine/threonine-protein kinase 24/25/MST4
VPNNFTYICVNIYCTCREESKQGSDLDEPWNMTVKGPHSIKPPNDEPANHKIPQKVQNGSGPPQTKSPPKDSNLNHYRSEKTTPVSILMCLEKE